MSAAVPVALLGFTAFEQQNIAACLRLTDRSGSSLVLTDRIADCRLAVVNADDSAAVAEVTRQGLLGRSLMLGQRPHPGAGMRLARPINPTGVLRALQQMARQETPASPAVQRALDDLAEVTATLAGHERPREMARAWAEGATSAAEAKRPDRRGEPDPVLVVDRDDVASRFIGSQLDGFGFQVQHVRSAEAALDLAATQRYEWVFVDAKLAVAKGCKLGTAIRDLSRQRGTAAPAVVVMAEPDTPLTVLADTGCESYLLRPLASGALRKLVADREVARQAFAPTVRTPSTRF